MEIYQHVQFKRTVDTRNGSEQVGEIPIQAYVQSAVEVVSVEGKRGRQLKPG